MALIPLPQFSTFHASFVFIVDATTAFLLFGQLVYRRLLSYCVLAAAFLFSALAMLPFLLCFLAPSGPGAHRWPASSVWVWHVWHALFPTIVALSLVMHERSAKRLLPERWLARAIAIAIAIVVLLVSFVMLVVSAFNDLLPVLIYGAQVPAIPAQFLLGGLAAVVTALAFILAARLLARQRTILHLWLAMVLFALLADEAASLGGYPRFTLGWYLGRIDWILAASVLLAVFLTDINSLYVPLDRRRGRVVRCQPGICPPASA